SSAHPKLASRGAHDQCVRCDIGCCRRRRVRRCAGSTKVEPRKPASGSNVTDLMPRDSSIPVERPVRESNATVVRLAAPGRTDEEIVRATRAREPWAAAALLDRYGAMVERIIRRVVGPDPELEDLVHDAFASCLASIGQVRDGDAVKGW